MTARRQQQSERGAALIFALMALSIFAILGTAYLRDMVITNQASGVVVDEARARLLAEAGIRAAIGDLAQARAAGQVRQVLGTRELSLPTYEGRWDGEAVRLAAREDRRATATYTVSDENARINLNYAPPSVLQAILGVDGATARKIGAAVRTEKLLHPADLRARGLLTPDQFDAVNLDLLTTYTVLDRETAEHFININTAPPQVLAAIADVPVEKAERADTLNLRPFKSMDNFAAAMEKDASTFNVRPSNAAPDEFPAALATASRCFRIRAAGETARAGGQGAVYGRTRAAIEAVVLFDASDGYDVVHWSAQRSD